MDLQSVSSTYLIYYLILIPILFLLLFLKAISGEVYKDYSSFHPRVCETLKTLIPDEVAAKLSVGIVKHSRIVGAAIVAMMAEKINHNIDML